MHCLLSDLVTCYPICASYGSPKQKINAIVHDSRTVQGGELFVALSGFHVDGQEYIDDAIRRGCSAVLCRKRPEIIHPSISYLVVRDPRHAMSVLSARFWNFPSRELFVIGVTGTDGKSTSVHIIHQLLEEAGVSAGFISTVAQNSDGETVENTVHLSTPEAFELHRQLAVMRDSGKKVAVIEATSHALSNRTMRLASVDFNAAMISNISHEHLDFHGTFAQYRSDKTELLRSLPNLPDSFAVLNADDPSVQYCAGHCACPNVLYYRLEGMDPSADAGFGGLDGEQLQNMQTNCLHARIIQEELQDCHVEMSWQGTTRQVSLPFPLNTYNVLSSVLTVASYLHCNPMDLCELSKIRLPAGRMEKISDKPAVFVDYAHTPGAFARIFPFFRKHSQGKIIAVFGSAGERDKKKRPEQGHIAGQYADIIILSDEDPRSEDPEQIVNDIAAGLETFQKRGGSLLRICNRETAIQRAVELASPHDTILLLGKGHEQSILYETQNLPWDEKNIARRALNASSSSR